VDYAIVEISGRQILVESGKFYDINRIDAGVGSKIDLNCVLLTNKNGIVEFGLPYINSKNIKAIILRQFSGVKLIIYRMKPKKKMRRKQGFRSKLTRILIE